MFNKKNFFFLKIENLFLKLIQQIEQLNDDPSIHGIIVQLPFDSVQTIDTNLIANTVSPDKDIDG